MTEIELVIKVSQESYNNLKIGCTQRVSDGEMIEAIKNGTPLPKGHGRLIDADTLEECKEVMNTIINKCEYAVRMDEVRNVTTIIEADRGRK